MAADPLTTTAVNQQVASQLVEACLRQGIDHFFLAPGSRCTPLTLAIAHCPTAHILQHVDERGLAFACLGYGRATRRPGAFVCTSGTAVANALPAVVEASLDNVPLLLLTADRPPELRSTGANQTIDQCKIFGPYVRWFFDLPCPALEFAARFWESSIRFAAVRAASGPVHINCMFREPFGGCNSAPEAVKCMAETELRETNITYQWRVPRGCALVIAGSCPYHEALAAQRLATRLGCPFLADITTGIRSLNYDLQLLRDDNPPADVILHVGGTIVSKRWWQFVDSHPPQHYLHLTPYGHRLDPLHRVTQIMRGPLQPLCDGALIDEPSTGEFLSAWTRGSEMSRRAADHVIDAQPTLSEPAVARAIAAVPHETGLFLGNSLPIRYMDQFGQWPASRRVYVTANRGASGIDGLVATSAGFATGLRRTTTALVGDLSALHDLNSMTLLARCTAPVVAVVINNDGGGIFHFLPVASQTSSFERFFATPHGRNFADAARMFDLAYDQPVTMQQLVASYRQASARTRSSVIEVRTDRWQNRQLQRDITEAVRRAPG